MAKNKPHTYKKKDNGKNNVGRKEKYTHEFVKSELKSMMEYIESEDGSHVVLIMELCNFRGFSHQRWSEITYKYQSDKEISDTIKRIENTLEVRLYNAALSNNANPTMAIFGLKNKYGWRDKQEIDQTVSVNTEGFTIVIDEERSSDAQKTGGGS